jgi:hypothetical protein
MKKLTPDVDALAVETFRPQAPSERHDGTVHAHADTQQIRCTYFCTYNCTGLPC